MVNLLSGCTILACLVVVLVENHLFHPYCSQVYVFDFGKRHQGIYVHVES